MPEDRRMPTHLIMPQAYRRRPAMRAFAATALTALLGLPRRAPAAEPAWLRIAGTGMALAAMRQVGDGFMVAQPEIAIAVLPSLGTAGGLAAVAGGAVELALSARALNDAERAKGLRSLAYARTPIAFVSHRSLTIRDITLAQVAQILTASLSTWPDGTPIRLVRREPSDADWTMLRGLSADMAAAVTVALGRPGLLTVATDQDNADTIERLPGSFGAMSLGQTRAENRRLVLLNLDGEAPDIAGITADRYKLSRTLYAVWRDPPSQGVALFLAYLRNARTGELLIRLGHIPLAGAAA